jgi:hypothetical protein
MVRHTRNHNSRQSRHANTLPARPSNVHGDPEISMVSPEFPIYKALAINQTIAT